MPKHKKSFFERLTGAVRIHDQDEITTDEEETLSVEVSDNPGILDEDSTDGELAVDVFQTPKEIIIKTMVAGVAPDNLEISVTRDVVTLKGKREESFEIDDKDYYHKELYWGSFSRTIVLPAEVEIEEAEAVEKQGLLTIRLPKIDKHKQSKLRVKGN